MIKTDCSNCRADLTLNTEALTLTMRVASNGRRGSLHVAAHTLTAEVGFDGDLYLWECPACGHADSYWPGA